MNNKKNTTQLFHNSFLEKLSRPNAIVVIISFAIFSLLIFLYGVLHTGTNKLSQFALYISGFIFFTLAEYLIHRFGYHSGKYYQEEHWQFKIHGVHHAYPKDKERLAMPLPLAIIIAGIIYLIFWIIMRSYALLFFPGFIAGYAFYLFVHFIIHTRRPPKNALRILWKHHYIHHYKEDNKAFGVTSPFWDIIFRTMPSYKNEVMPERKH